MQVVKLLMEHGGDPNLPNEKEQTPLDVCPNEEIRRLLTASFSPPTQHALSTPPTALPASVSQGEGNREPIESEVKVKPSDETHSQDDSAFSPNPPPVPLQSVHRKVEIQSTTPSGSTASEAPTPQSVEPVNATPSRTRKRSKREGEKGRGFGDVSSDSELLVTVRKVPRLMDRLLDSVREEGGGGGGGVRCGEGEGEKGDKTDGITERGDKNEPDEELVDVEKDGDEVREEKDGAIDAENREEEKSTNSGKQDGKDERELPSSDDKPLVGQEEEGKGVMEEKASADVASNAAEKSTVAAGGGERETGEPEEHSAGKETEVEKCTTEETTAERGIIIHRFLLLYLHTLVFTRARVVQETNALGALGKVDEI